MEITLGTMKTTEQKTVCASSCVFLHCLQEQISQCWKMLERVTLGYYLPTIHYGASAAREEDTEIPEFILQKATLGSPGCRGLTRARIPIIPRPHSAGGLPGVASDSESLPKIKGNIPVKLSRARSDLVKQSSEEPFYLVCLIHTHVLQVLHDELHHLDVSPLSCTVEQVPAILERR